MALCVEILRFKPWKSTWKAAALRGGRGGRVWRGCYEDLLKSADAGRALWTSPPHRPAEREKFCVLIFTRDDQLGVGVWQGEGGRGEVEGLLLEKKTNFGEIAREVTSRGKCSKSLIFTVWNDERKFSSSRYKVQVQSLALRYSEWVFKPHTKVATFCFVFFKLGEAVQHPTNRLRHTSVHLPPIAFRFHGKYWLILCWRSVASSSSRRESLCSVFVFLRDVRGVCPQE